MRDVRRALEAASGGEGSLGLEGVLQAFAFLRIQLTPQQAQELIMEVSPQRVDGCVSIEQLVKLAGSAPSPAKKTRSAYLPESKALAGYRTHLATRMGGAPLLESEVRRLWRASDERRQWLAHNAHCPPEQTLTA